MLVEKPEKTTIPSTPKGEFGMDSVKEVPKYKPNVVKESEEINNVVKID